MSARNIIVRFFKNTSEQSSTLGWALANDNTLEKFLRLKQYDILPHFTAGDVAVVDRLQVSRFLPHRHNGDDAGADQYGINEGSKVLVYFGHLIIYPKFKKTKEGKERKLAYEALQKNPNATFDEIVDTFPEFLHASKQVANLKKSLAAEICREDMTSFYDGRGGFAVYIRDERFLLFTQIGFNEKQMVKHIQGLLVSLGIPTSVLEDIDFTFFSARKQLPSPSVTARTRLDGNVWGQRLRDLPADRLLLDALTNHWKRVFEMVSNAFLKREHRTLIATGANNPLQDVPRQESGTSQQRHTGKRPRNESTREEVNEESENDDEREDREPTQESEPDEDPPLLCLVRKKVPQLAKEYLEVGSTDIVGDDLPCTLVAAPDSSWCAIRKGHHREPGQFFLAVTPYNVCLRCKNENCKQVLEEKGKEGFSVKISVKEAKNIYSEFTRKQGRKKQKTSVVSDDELQDVLRLLPQDRYCYVKRGKYMVIIDEKDTVNGKPCLVEYTEQQLFKSNMHRGLTYPKLLAWLAHPNTRVYTKEKMMPGVKGHLDKEGVYNLWRGFACEPEWSDTSTPDQVLKEVTSLPGPSYTKKDLDIVDDALRFTLWCILHAVCGSDPERFCFVMMWMAFTFQYPGKLPLTSLTLRGKEGTGKGFLLEKIWGKLFGEHFFYLNDVESFTSKFNLYLRYALAVFLDEVNWKNREIGVIKSRITNRIQLQEGKGTNQTKGKHCYKIVTATNEDISAPVGQSARRFIPIQTNERFKLTIGEPFYDKWLKCIKLCRPKLLHLFLNLNIQGFKPYVIPRAVLSELWDQKKTNMDEITRIWFAVLQEGCITSNNGIDYPLNEETDTFVPKRVILEMSPTKSCSRFWEKLCPLIPGRFDPSQATRQRCNNRERMLVIPPLRECRVHFATCFEMQNNTSILFPEDNNPEGKSEPGPSSSTANLKCVV